MVKDGICENIIIKSERHKEKIYLLLPSQESERSRICVLGSRICVLGSCICVLGSRMCVRDQFCFFLLFFTVRFYNCVVFFVILLLQDTKEIRVTKR